MKLIRSNISDDKFELNRFYTFITYYGIVTLTPTLTLALTMTVLTFWSEMQWAEKGVTPPTAFLTTASPTLTLTLVLTMTVLTFWSEMQWAEKGVTIWIQPYPYRISLLLIS